MNLEVEQSLVLRSKTDVQAFAELYEEYYSLILNYVIRRTGNVDLSKDIVSNTFLKAMENIQGFQWRNVPFSAWLYRIANNEISQMYRDAKKQAISLDQLQEAYGFDFESSELTEEILKAQVELEERHQQFLFYQNKILELPIKYQEVISLRYFEEKSMKEIAKILNKREGTIKSLLHRGLEKLRNIDD
ncbi:MAG: RNA polymerase sigma factor [Erysipelotrichaceae bacterium]|jgi:RNA polymerase sigma-70 factor (ECF subfamily)